MQHPAARLLVWGVVAVAVQLLDGKPLYLAASLFLGLAAFICATRLLRLLSRTRWLLLAVAVMFSFSTPGVLLLPDLGVLSPTTDGLDLAAIHLSKLLAVLSSLALLMALTPPPDFVSAIYGLLAPASRIGLDRGRIAVRLMLVMQYAESARGGAWREWLEPAVPDGPQRIVLADTPWRWRDSLAIGVALLALTSLLAA
jgi:energy-coupling factor transporter transmembrane protein EcfT